MTDLQDAPTVVVPRFATWAPLLGKYLDMRIHEFAGPADNHPQIAAWLQNVGAGSQDEIPWCSASACGIMEEAGFKTPHSAHARSWEGWGEKLVKPRAFCIRVLWRESPQSGKGHVCWYVAPSSLAGYSICIGGNQLNSFCVTTERDDHLLSDHWPNAATIA